MVATPTTGPTGYGLTVKTATGMRQPTRAEIDEYRDKMTKEQLQQSNEIKKKNPQSKLPDAEIIKRNNLQPIIALPPVGETMPALSEIFSTMLHKPNLQLSVIDAYESKDISRLKPGDVVRIIHTMPQHSVQYLTSKNDEIAFSIATLNIRHYKQATKGFGIGAIIFIYNKNTDTFSYVTDFSKLTNISKNNLTPIFDAPRTTLSTNS